MSGLTLVLVGDVNLGRVPEPFEKVATVLARADLRFGNCESCFTNSREEIPFKPGWSNAPPSAVHDLADAGFDVVGCANNIHFGSEAIRETLGLLDANGIRHVGAGENRALARAAVVLERVEGSIGFLAYSSLRWPVGHAAGAGQPGIATAWAHTAYRPGERVLEMPGAPPEIVTWMDDQELAAALGDVRRLRERADIVVVSCHWGVSGSNAIEDYQLQLGRALVDSGADVVIGHHPHVVQGVEVRRGRPIFYSLGNFVFGYDGGFRGMLVTVQLVGGKLAAASWTPVIGDERGQPRIADPRSEGRELVAELEGLSARFQTRQQISGEQVQLLDTGGD